MSAEEIEARLNLIGVLDFDRTQFIASAKSLESAWAIGEDWGRGLVGLSSADQEFLGLAACELWRRLCPEHPSVEMVDDWLCEGYAYADEKKPFEAMSVWWKVWETLRPRFTSDMRNLNDVTHRLFPFMSQLLSNWSGDFCMEALNSAQNNPQCGELGIRFIGEVLEALPAEDENLNLSGDLAMIYFDLGHEAEGEAVCQRLIQNHPYRATGYVHLSDALFRRSDAGSLERAIGLLEQALAKPVKDAADFDVAARLKDARELLAKTKPVRPRDPPDLTR